MSRIASVLALCCLASAGAHAQFVGPPYPAPETPAAAAAPAPSSGIRSSRVVITDLPDAPPLGAGATEPSPVIRSRQRFSSGQDSVLADILRPRAPGRFPAVVLLHGADPRRGESLYYDMAEDLAKNGFVCLFVRYYNRGRKNRGTRAQWTRTVGDALTFAATLPDVDESRMALLGYSLGAFLALTYAPTDTRVQAVVAYYGGVQPCDMPNALKHMPPTLLLHGTYDRTVPVRHSIEAFQQLRLKSMPVDLVIYPEVGHGFTLHNYGGWDEKVAHDSWARVIAFLDFHLKYPAWTPEVEPPEPSGPEDTAAPSPPRRDLFADLPALKMPYLEQLDAQGSEKVLVDPTPEELSALATKIPPPSRRSGLKASAKGKAKPGGSAKAHGTAKPRATAKAETTTPLKGAQSPQSGTPATPVPPAKQ